MMNADLKDSSVMVGKDLTNSLDFVTSKILQWWYILTLKRFIELGDLWPQEHRLFGYDDLKVSSNNMNQDSSNMVTSEILQIWRPQRFFRYWVILRYSELSTEKLISGGGLRLEDTGTMMTTSIFIPPHTSLSLSL